MQTETQQRKRTRFLLQAALTALTLLTGTLTVQAQSRLYSWGQNAHLQLGSGSSTDRRTPGTVKASAETSTLTNITSVTAGGQFSLAVRNDGTMLGWGYNSSGQLGNGTTANSLKPVQVQGFAGGGVLTDVVSAAAGFTHSLALKSDGTVWAWGSNGWSQVGDGTQTQRNTPVPVKGQGGVGFLTDVAEIATGESHNLARKYDGSLWVWGFNGYGQLGDGTTANRSTPVQVKGQGNVGFLTDVAAAAGGAYFSLALKTDGTVWAWGNNGSGQLGNGTNTGSSAPVQVKGQGGNGFLTNVVAISAGDYFSVALKSDGTVWAWGTNGSGQLGNNTNTGSNTPVQVVGPGGNGFLTGISAIAAGDQHVLAQKSDGTVWAWGNNNSWMLGDGTAQNRRTPVQVLGVNGAGFLTDITSIAGGQYHSVAARADGTVWCWGWNQYGQLGNDTTTNSTTPTRTIGPEGLDVFPNATAVVASAYHTAVLRGDGTVYTFGSNSSGQLGDGTTTSRSVAVQVKGPDGVGVLTNIIAIAVGDYHTVALRDDGTVWAWGHNGLGQLGDDTLTLRQTPVQVKGPGGAGVLTNIVAIAAGTTHTLAIRRDGAVFGWGSNNNGQLGDGTLSNRKTPVAMLNASGSGPIYNIVSVAAGQYHSLLLSASGGVFTCGDNSSGQLGDGTTLQRNRPVRVLGPSGIGSLNSIVSVSAGQNHSVALYYDGTVYAWGKNSSGQLGDNTTTDSLTPITVVGPGGVGLLGDVATVVAGKNHNLAVKFDGTVWAWGNNSSGQLGDNTITNRPAPIQALGPDGNGLLTGIFAIAVGESHSVVINGQGVFQGSVILQNSACSDANIRFEFRPTDGGAPIIRNLIAGPLEVFTFADIPPGTYDVAVKGNKWLQRVAYGVNTGSNNVLNLRVFLLAGDANDDNSADVFDLNLLIQAFNSVDGDDNWNANTDFNCDDSVDVLDLDLLIQNFNLTGDA